MKIQHHQSIPLGILGKERGSGGGGGSGSGSGGWGGCCWCGGGGGGRGGGGGGVFIRILSYTDSVVIYCILYSVSIARYT